MQTGYMTSGYAPPGARTEQLGRDVPVPRDIHCEEVEIPSADNAVLTALVAQKKGADPARTDCVILYLQGSSLRPPPVIFLGRDSARPYSVQRV